MAKDAQEALPSFSVGARWHPRLSEAVVAAATEPHQPSPHRSRPRAASALVDQRLTKKAALGRRGGRLAALESEATLMHIVTTFAVEVTRAAAADRSDGLHRGG